MPTGISEKLTEVVHRKQGDGDLRIMLAGPFIETYINGVYVGKVRRLSRATIPCSPGFEDIAENCIRLPNHTILLTVEEEIDIINQRQVLSERSH